MCFLYMAPKFETVRSAPMTPKRLFLPYAVFSDWLMDTIKPAPKGSRYGAVNDTKPSFTAARINLKKITRIAVIIVESAVNIL